MPPNPLTASSSSTATSDPSWPKTASSVTGGRERARRTSGLTSSRSLRRHQRRQSDCRGQARVERSRPHHKQGCRRAHAAGRQRQETDRRGNCADRANRREKAPNGKAIGPTSPGSPSGSPDRCIGRARFVTKSTALSAQTIGAWTAARAADRITLIRRLSFDMTGLPPKPKKRSMRSSTTTRRCIRTARRSAARFAALRRADGRLVARSGPLRRHDRLPRQPAKHHAYRDYVIESFNVNKPFDQFTVEQLAGDLIPMAARAK